MNGLVTDHGKMILNLKDQLAGFNWSVRSSVDMAAVVDLQQSRGARLHRLSALERHRRESVDDRTRIETEMRGYRRALSLFEDPQWGEGSSRSVDRLLSRVEVRIAEAEKCVHEIDEIESEIHSAETELRLVEGRLVDALRSCVAVASSQHAANLAAVRWRAVAGGDTLPDHVESMWSPTSVLGYRVWGLGSDGFYGARERWRESTYAAVCASGDGIPHTDGRCSDVAFGCGIYAAKDMGQLLGSTAVTARQDFAAGLVALEGKVVEHERGYRAERATVVSLIIVQDGVMSIVEDPLEMRDTFSDPWDRGTETVVLPAVTGNDHMRRTIVDQLKKREEGQITWT